jgi:hypothetical protein
MTVFVKGKLVRSSAAFTNSAGAAIDPTAVKVTVRTPAKVSTTYVYGTDAALVKDSAGNYHLDIDASLSGFYYTYWFSTGTGQAAEESFFEVIDPIAG